MEFLPTKYDLEFNPPLMNAAGSLGFAPDPHGPLELSRLGGFITNPISLNRRTPARQPRYLTYPGGFLLHTGYPNPGLKAVLRRYAEQWQRSPLPVVVHLLCQEAAETQSMARRLEQTTGVAGLELSFPPQATPATIGNVVRALQVELPVILRLRLDEATWMASELAQSALPLAAISLGAPRGALPVAMAATTGDRPTAQAHGRLYGPALFPLALETVRTIHQMGLPVIGACGVYQPEQADAMLAAGALAVQVDAVLWRGGF